MQSYTIYRSWKEKLLALSSTEHLGVNSWKNEVGNSLLAPEMHYFSLIRYIFFLFPSLRIAVNFLKAKNTVNLFVEIVYFISVRVRKNLRLIGSWECLRRRTNRLGAGVWKHKKGFCIRRKLKAVLTFQSALADWWMCVDILR